MDTGMYALGQLGRVRTMKLRRHLAKCAACRAELAELEMVAGWLQRVKSHFRNA